MPVAPPGDLLQFTSSLSGEVLGALDYMQSFARSADPPTESRAGQVVL